MQRFIASARAYLGGIALGLGGIGMLLFVMGMVLNAALAAIFSTAEDRTSWQFFTDRLLPLLVISTGLIGYGYYEALNEKRSGKAR